MAIGATRFPAVLGTAFRPWQMSLELTAPSSPSTQHDSGTKGGPAAVREQRKSQNSARLVSQYSAFHTTLDSSVLEEQNDRNLFFSFIADIVRVEVYKNEESSGFKFREELQSHGLKWEEWLTGFFVHLVPRAGCSVNGPRMRAVGVSIRPTAFKLKESDEFKVRWKPARRIDCLQNKWYGPPPFVDKKTWALKGAVGRAKKRPLQRFLHTTYGSTQSHLASSLLMWNRTHSPFSGYHP